MEDRPTVLRGQYSKSVPAPRSPCADVAWLRPELWATSRADRRGARPERRIADAMVETDPIDSLIAAAGVAVAQLDSPRRRPCLANEAEPPLHRLSLGRHAVHVPAARQADVEQGRVVERRPLGPRPGGGAAQDDGCHSSRGPLHPRGNAKPRLRLQRFERSIQPRRTSKAPANTRRTPAIRVIVTGCRVSPSRP